MAHYSLVVEVEDIWFRLDLYTGRIVCYNGYVVKEHVLKLKYNVQSLLEYNNSNSLGLKARLFLPAMLHCKC